MLLLGRNLGESIVIGDNIYITFVETDKSGQKFKLAIDAPKDVKKRWNADTPRIMEELTEVIRGIDDFSSAAAEKVVLDWIASKGYHLGNVMNAFRLTVVGECKGPHMFDITELMGKEETINRINRGRRAITLPE